MSTVCWNKYIKGCEDGYIAIDVFVLAYNCDNNKNCRHQDRNVLFSVIDRVLELYFNKHDKLPFFREDKNIESKI